MNFIVGTYVDPGAGGLILQLILSAIFGFFAFFWKRISRVLGIGKKQSMENAASEQTTNSPSKIAPEVKQNNKQQ